MQLSRHIGGGPRPLFDEDKDECPVGWAFCHEVDCHAVCGHDGAFKIAEAQISVAERLTSPNW